MGKSKIMNLNDPETLCIGCLAPVRAALLAKKKRSLSLCQTSQTSKTTCPCPHWRIPLRHVSGLQHVEHLPQALAFSLPLWLPLSRNTTRSLLFARNAKSTPVWGSWPSPATGQVVRSLAAGSQLCTRETSGRLPRPFNTAPCGG